MAAVPPAGNINIKYGWSCGAVAGIAAVAGAAAGVSGQRYPVRQNAYWHDRAVPGHRRRHGRPPLRRYRLVSPPHAIRLCSSIPRISATTTTSKHPPRPARTPPCGCGHLNPTTILAAHFLLTLRDVDRSCKRGTKAERVVSWPSRYSADGGRQQGDSDSHVMHRRTPRFCG